MAIQLWADSKLGALPTALKKKIKFYAPLRESIDFMGVDPVTFTAPGGQQRIGRDGLVHNLLGPNTPRFDFVGDTPSGLWLQAGYGLQYSAFNVLHDGNTLIWTEQHLPKSTPTNANPFASNGTWAGNLSVYVKEIVKADRVLTNAEINQIQQATIDVAQVIPPPVTPPVVPAMTFMSEQPSGTVNGSNVTFTLSQAPDINSLIVTYSGLTLRRVTSGPGNMEFTLSGTTVTMGLAPQVGYTFNAHYVVA